MSHNTLSKNLLAIGKLVFGITYLAAAGSAFAGSGAPLLTAVDPWLSVNGNVDLIPQAGGTNDGKNDFSFSGTGGTAQYAIDWSLNVNPDPFVNGSFSITNLSSSAQDFTVTLNLPVTPSFSPGIMSGSIDATIFDKSGDGSASLQPTSSNSNIYFGTIDGLNALSLFGMGLTCNGAPSPGCSINSSDAQSSIPVSGVNTKIGTKLIFNLSAGDQVTFLTHFEVLPVPVPAAAWLMGSALVGLAGVRRKQV